MADLTLAAMEADLGDDIARRLFESKGDKERGSNHRQGAGASLFNLKAADRDVVEWHKFHETDDMRDLRAEAAGDINQGQTRRLNRIDQGIVPVLRHPVMSASSPFHGGILADRTNANTASMAGKSGLDVAREMAAGFKKSGGKDAEYAKRKSGPIAAQNARPPPKKLPAKLPGPPIPIPRGARKAMDAKSIVSNSSSRSQTSSHPSVRRKEPSKPRPARPMPQPALLASPSEFLASIPAGPGLGRSKHAPNPQPQPSPTTTAPAAAPAAEKRLQFPAVVPAPAPPTKPVKVSPVAQLKLPPFVPRVAASVVQLTAPAVVPTKAPLVVPTNATPAMIPINTKPVIPVVAPPVKPVTFPTVSAAAVARVSDIATRPVRPEHVASSSEQRFMDNFVEVTALMESASGKVPEARQTTTDETAFADVSEDWVCGADAGEQESTMTAEEETTTASEGQPAAEALSKQYPNEGILPDGRVKGGPYFLAAIIAHIPRIANAELGL